MMVATRCAPVLTPSGVTVLPLAALAQPTLMVRVDLQCQHTGVQSEQGVQGRGVVIVTERGAVRPRGSLGAGSTATRTRQSTGIFTLVQDGGESTLTVATQVPYPQVAFYRDYATGA